MKSVGEMMSEASAGDADAAAELRELEDKVEKDPGTPEFQPKAAKAAKPKKSAEDKAAEKAAKDAEKAAAKEAKAAEAGEKSKGGRKPAVPDTTILHRTAKTAREGTVAARIANALTGSPAVLSEWVERSGLTRSDVQAAVRAGYLASEGGEKSAGEVTGEEAKGEEVFS